MQTYIFDKVHGCSHPADPSAIYVFVYDDGSCILHRRNGWSNQYFGYALNPTYGPSTKGGALRNDSRYKSFDDLAAVLAKVCAGNRYQLRTPEVMHWSGERMPPVEERIDPAYTPAPQPRVRCTKWQAESLRKRAAKDHFRSRVRANTGVMQLLRKPTPVGVG